jgi:hypothetical protein
MQNIYENRDGKNFSEGSTQAIKRKIRSETIQRIPDAQIISQYDKNSIEQIELEYIFENKVITSEYDGRDMLKNLWKTFNASYDYGFACVRTGFEHDLDGDFRISYKQIPYNDVYPAPDCDCIEEANWYMIREYLSKSDIKDLVDEDGCVKDSTYNQDVVTYLIQNPSSDGVDPRSIPLADAKKGSAKHESIEIWTLYKRGEDTFETFCPAASAILRTVDNYDPRHDVPLHFMILEPDPEFPLGCSSVLWTLSQQQFADAFQTSSYQSLLLATNPPILQYGNLSNSHIQMKPRSIWNMGTNANNKVEKFPVETTTITQYGQILNNISANMMKNLNVTESNVATDANTLNYSATPQGVEQQKRDKTTTVNTYQKRVETFFSEWANHALRSYINAMGGVQELEVNEKTRRRIWDVEKAQSNMNPDGTPDVDSIINENKISIDFDALSTNLLELKVRAGSLIQGEREEEIQNIQNLLVPVSQMLGNLSEENRGAFESIIMQLVSRMCELSNIDIAAQTSSTIEKKIITDAIQATMEQVMQQQQQIDGMQQQMQQQQGMPQALPEQQMPEQQMQPQDIVQQATPDQGMPQDQGMPLDNMGANAPESNPVSTEFPEQGLGA